MAGFSPGSAKPSARHAFDRTLSVLLCWAEVQKPWRQGLPCTWCSPMSRALVNTSDTIKWLPFWAHATYGDVSGSRQLCGAIQKGMIRRVCQEGQPATARHLPCRTVTRHSSWAAHTMAVWPPSFPHQ